MAKRVIALIVVFCCTAVLQAAENETKDPYKGLSKEKRIEAVRLAQVWVPIDTASLDLKAGPSGTGAFPSGQVVTCEYLTKDSGGKTPKFWCAIAPSDEVKVKYGEANGEVYAEVAATRLLWALGFGADAMYPVAVICRGCAADPFKEKRKQQGEVRFDPAVIERPMTGDVMESGKDSGWGWIDLNSVDQTRGGALVAHRDALKLLAVFMQHTDTKPSQQRLLCLDRMKGLQPAADGSCAHPFMMLADIGKTFGKANLRNKDNPGAVNLKAWQKADIWRNDKECVGDMDQSFTGTLDRPRISEEGRKFLAERLNQLSDAQIRDLFEVAQVTRRDKESTLDGWVETFKQKREQIATRTCSSAEPVTSTSR
jgi:hypothetical protein